MLHSFFPYQLAITAEAFSRQLTNVYKVEFGLSREEWRLLFLLAQSESVTSRKLSEMTSLDKVQVSRAADRLENKKLILREVSPDDRRLRRYSCTKKGKTTFSEAYSRVNERASAILNEMNDHDRAALDRGLGALSAIMKTHLSLASS